MRVPSHAKKRRKKERKQERDSKARGAAGSARHAHVIAKREGTRAIQMQDPLLLVLTMSWAGEIATSFICISLAWTLGLKAAALGAQASVQKTFWR